MLPSTRGKRRNMEKRREKSRCAARTRREKEAGIFTDLYETVPIVSESTITHVDRIAVLRLAATFCRVRRVAEKVFPQLNDAVRQSSHIFAEGNVNECLDGFLMLVDSSGLIIYISPNCSRSLGLTQTDLIGQNIHDYLHLDDSVSFVSTLSNAAAGSTNVMLRMKSVLSPRGRNLTLKSAVFRSVSFAVQEVTVEFPPVQPRRPASRTSPAGDVSDFEDDDDATDTPATQLDNTYFQMHGLPIPHCNAGAMGDYHGPGTFMTRHTMDMKFSYCHERLSDYLGFDSKSLMGSSFYSLVHPEDLRSLTMSLKDLYRKGHARTTYYRMMVKTGGVVWITTSANTVSHSTRGHGGQYVVCLHQMISGVENREVTADVQQTAPSLLCKMESERKVKQAKIVGPTTEQLLQRAPTVSDYIPLTNPSLLTNGVGMRYLASGDKSRGLSDEYSQERLFRNVGGIEKRKARQRRDEDCSNVVSGVPYGHVDAAANISIRAPKDKRTASRNDNVFIPSIVPLDSITQDDIQHVLYSTMPPSGIQPATAVPRGKAIKHVLDNDQTSDELSSLAPFIHHTDEIPLDFVQSDGSCSILSPNLLNELNLDSEDFGSISNQCPGGGSVDTAFMSPHGRTNSADKVAKDEIMEKEIQSIYRYLRDDNDDPYVLPVWTDSDAAQSLPVLINLADYAAQYPPPLLIMDSCEKMKKFGSSSFGSSSLHFGQQPSCGLEEKKGGYSKSCYNEAFRSCKYGGDTSALYSITSRGGCLRVKDDQGWTL